MTQNNHRGSHSADIELRKGRLEMAGGLMEQPVVFLISAFKAVGKVSVSK